MFSLLKCPFITDHNRNACLCRIVGDWISAADLSSYKGHQGGGTFLVLITEFQSLKLFGCNAMMFSFLQQQQQQCGGLKDTGSQFGSMHNLDASSVSSNIPWKPKLPAELPAGSPCIFHEIRSWLTELPHLSKQSLNIKKTHVFFVLKISVEVFRQHMAFYITASPLHSESSVVLMNDEHYKKMFA